MTVPGRGLTNGGFDPVDFLETAVDIPSHEDVTEMRAYLVETLRAGGTDPDVTDAGVVVASRGTGRPHLVLNTHVDTVPPHLPPSREGDRLVGRGACDAKGPLSAMVAAFLAASPGDGRITLAVTPDEERTSTGAAALVGELDADAVVVGEPTGLDVCNAARGRFQGIVTIDGESAHAAEPASGVNAIVAAGAVISALDRFDERRGPSRTGSELGGPTLTPTMIDGGLATNQVPDRCRITIDRRSVPPETAATFAADLNEYLGDRVPEANARYAHAERETPFLEAFRTDPAERVVRVLEAAGAGSHRPFGAATEASYFARIAPTVVFGPGELADESGPVAHSRREYVELASVRRAADVLARATRRFLE